MCVKTSFLIRATKFHSIIRGVTLIDLNAAAKVFKLNFYNSCPINMVGMLDMNGEKTTERALNNVKCILC
jgi:hypothetical protein